MSEISLCICDISIIDFPSLTKRLIAFYKNLLDEESIPLVGSSKNAIDMVFQLVPQLLIIFFYSRKVISLQKHSNIRKALNVLILVEHVHFHYAKELLLNVPSITYVQRC